MSEFRIISPGVATNDDGVCVTLHYSREEILYEFEGKKYTVFYELGIHRLENGKITTHACNLIDLFWIREQLDDGTYVNIRWPAKIINRISVDLPKVFDLFDCKYEIKLKDNVVWKSSEKKSSLGISELKTLRILSVASLTASLVMGPICLLWASFLNGLSEPGEIFGMDNFILVTPVALVMGVFALATGKSRWRWLLLMLLLPLAYCYYYQFRYFYLLRF